MIYFTSDTHFGHKNIIKLTQANFSSIEERDALIIKNIAALKGNDTLYILGDLSWYNAPKTIEIFRQFKCRIVVIKGNHDSTETLNRLLREDLIDSWHYYLELKGDLIAPASLICLMHYPIEEWNGYFKSSSAHLHGHIHGKKFRNVPNERPDGRLNINRFDIGVDANNYAPIKLQTVLDVLEKGVGLRDPENENNII